MHPLPRKTCATGLLIPPLALLAIALTSMAQTERQVEVAPQASNEPLIFTKVALGDTPLMCGLVKGMDEYQAVVPFHASDDWIENLRVEFLNRTVKPVAFVGLRLWFPDTGDGRSRAIRVYNVPIGRIPDVAAFGQDGHALAQPSSYQRIWFAPGQTMAVQLRDHIDRISSAVRASIPLSSVTRLKIDIAVCYFSDGTKWAGGGYRVPDREHPGTWKVLPRTYFPGNVLANWPPLPEPAK
jgi:hypothetical protein